MRILIRFSGIAAFVVAFFTLLAACGANDAASPDKPGTGPFGETCHGPGNCASGKCVRFNETEGICSKDCTDNLACPNFANWGCVDASGGTRVCACRPVDPNRCGEAVDNDCNGAHDDCNDCGGTLVSKIDPRNCGGCGVVCRDDQKCTGKGCECIAAGAVDCNGKCVNPTTDKAHCGGCGRACRNDQACVEGACKCTSAKPDACGAECVDLKSDRYNCGTCDTVCPSPQTCQNGKCSCEASFPDFCAGVGCRNTKTDPSHCGGCGKACPTGASCTNGQCACPANAATVCNGACVDLSTNAQNCSECGKSCTSGQYCAAGKCACATSGTTLCNGSCVATTFDADNCGACGRKCRVGESCFYSDCNCASGVVCNDVCRPTNDVANCGACGKACGPTQYCSSGTCSCTGGYTACGTSCVDTSSDVTNCGACGRTCRTGELCRFGSCGCPSGQTYCASAGKCADLARDPTSCGSCTNACSPTQQCVSGSCTCGVTGQSYCASANRCIDLVSNSQNCGACDRACPAQTTCTSGNCVCSTSGLTLCGSTCRDLQTNNAHCGACNGACDSALSCNAGKCRCPAPTLGAEVRVTTTKAVNPAVAWNGTHLGVVYYDTSARSGSSGGNVKFTLLNPDGSRALAQDIAVTSFVGDGSLPTVTAPPDIVWTGSEWGIVWTETSRRPSDPTRWYSDAMLGRFSANGTALASPVRITAASPNGLSASGDLRLAFSAAGGGYAIAAYGQFNQGIDFQRIGTTGATPGPVNHVDATFYSPYSRLGFAAAPDGRWGVLMRQSYQMSLVEFNADGSRTKNPIIVDNEVSYRAEPDLTHDGTSWVGAWSVVRSVEGRSRFAIAIARGPELGSRSDVVAPLDERVAATRISVSTGAAVLAWTEYQSETSFTSRFARVRLPAGTGAPVLITDPSALVTTPTVGPQAAMFALAHAGANAFVTVWGDTRWGGTNLYALSTNLRNCK